MHFSNVLNNTFTLVLLALLLVAMLVLFLYYGLIWLRTARRIKFANRDGEQPQAEGQPSVSIVMVVHNEAEYLKQSIPYLLEQDYPDFEVVIVDYMSTDDTGFVLQLCETNYPGMIKPVMFKQDVNMFRGKKYPLSIGIKTASKDIILLTEPGCVPISDNFNWIARMVSNYGKGTSMVLGYATVQQRKSLLNAFQRYDIMTYSSSYLGMAMMGHPYTGSGRNLSYRRDFFFGSGAFFSNYSNPDGADDLFVNGNADKRNTAVALHKEASVSFVARESYSEWRSERAHRLCTRRYSFADRLTMAVYPATQCLFWASWLWLIIAALFPWQILVAVLVVRMAWQIVCSALLAKSLEMKKVGFFSPFFELYFLFSNTILSLFALHRKK